MAQHIPRVHRVFSLPLPQWDHLKVFQRDLQRAADAEGGFPAREGDAHWVSGSNALTHLLHLSGLFGFAAGQAGMTMAEFATALYMGDLRVVAKIEEQA